MIRWIWIFFLPIFPLLQWEVPTGGRGHDQGRSVEDAVPLWSVWVTVEHAGQAQSRRGWRRRRGRAGLGVGRLPQIMVLRVGARWSTAQAELGSCALPFTSAQQLLKKQQGDAGVYLFTLTHFSCYKHLVRLRPGRTTAQSGALRSPRGPRWRCARVCRGSAVLRAKQETLRAPVEGGCAVSASLEASLPHRRSAGRPRQPAARRGSPRTRTGSRSLAGGRSDTRSETLLDIFNRKIWNQRNVLASLNTSKDKSSRSKY